jgi:hypothetical protein
MCIGLDSGLLAAAYVLNAILALLFAVRLWVAVGDYLLRRRVTLRGAISRAYGRFEGRLVRSLLK